jgi:hypothetical protein
VELASNLRAVTSLARIRTIWSGVAGSPYYTNLYFTDNPSDPPGIQPYADAWFGFLSDLTTTMHSNVTAVIQDDVPIIDDVTGDLTGARTINGGTIDMQGAGDMLPPTVQLPVRLETGVVRDGRRLRGKFYLPCQIEGLNDPTGVPTNALIQLVQSSFTEFLTAADELRVWHRPRAASAGPPPVEARAGDSVIVSGGGPLPYWGSMRSRRD